MRATRPAVHNARPLTGKYARDHRRVELAPRDVQEVVEWRNQRRIGTGDTKVSPPQAVAPPDTANYPLAATAAISSVKCRAGTKGVARNARSLITSLSMALYGHTSLASALEVYRRKVSDERLTRT